MSFSSGRNISNNVNTDEAQTLTNKTIDSANNSLVVDADTATVSNIEADNLKAGVIDDDLSTTSVNDDTVPSAKAAKAYTDAAAATAASDLSTHEADTSTHGVSGDVVGTSDTQTLTNKTIQGASVETPSRLDAKKDTLANLETYATTATDGELTYATDDEKFYGVVNNELVSLGGGLGSAQTVFTIEADSVNVAADVDGNDATFGGNDASSLTGTLSQSTTASELLTGVKKVNKYEAAASSQFDYFGYTRAIPQGWAGRTVAVEFTYRNNANTSNDDYTFNVKDETNNSVLLTRSLEAKVSADGNGETLRYLVNIPSDCLSVTIGFQNVGTATDTALFFDKISMDIDDFNYKNVSDNQNYHASLTSSYTIDTVNQNEGSDLIDINTSPPSRNIKLTAKQDCVISLNVSGTTNGGRVLIALYANDDTTEIGVVDDSTTSNHSNNALTHYHLAAGEGIFVHFPVFTGTFNRAHLNFHAQAQSKHVVVDSGEADVESYTAYQQNNFWDAGGTISTFNTGLLVPSITNSKLVEIQEISSQTRIVAKEDIVITGMVQGYLNTLGNRVVVVDSTGNAISEYVAAFGGDRGAAPFTTRLSAGEYVYLTSVGQSTNRQGSLSFRVEKANKGEYHLVPVNDQENVYSARIANNGTATVTSESSSFIDSVTRSSTGRVDIVFKSGIFTEIPSITATISDLDGSLSSASASSVTSTGCRIFTEVSSSAADRDFHIVVQKQGADYNEPKAFIGEVATDFYQSKKLTADIGSTTVDIANLRFENLVIGRSYRIDVHADLGGSTSNVGELTAIHDGNNLTRAYVDLYSGQFLRFRYSTYAVFTATATTLTFDYATNGGVTLYGNDTFTETFATLTELNNAKETSRF